MSSFLKIPRVQLALTLLLIYLSSLNLSNLYLVLLCVGFTIFFDLLFVYARTKKFLIPYSALISGLIIALIIDPNALWYQTIIICGLAMAVKNFVRVSGRHIFNPAALGLFLGGVMFNLNVSWWGVSFQNIQTHFWSFLILLTPGLISFYRMKRFGSILSFLITYTLINFFNNNLLDPTILFFATVMLPEPKTSPFAIKRQVFYGAVVAILALIFSYLPSSFLPITLPDILIPALLVGNVLFFFFK